MKNRDLRNANGIEEAATRSERSPLRRNLDSRNPLHFSQFLPESGRLKRWVEEEPSRGREHKKDPNFLSRKKHARPDIYFLTGQIFSKSRRNFERAVISGIYPSAFDLACAIADALEGGISQPQRKVMAAFSG